MTERTPLSGWERNVLWIVFTILIAGWWGILGVLLKWRIGAPAVVFATLNIVLTLRFAVRVAGKRSANFQRLFVLLAQMTGVWFPIAVISLPVLLFGGFYISACLAYLMGPAYFRSPHGAVVMYALTVSIGMSGAALLSVFAARRRLLASEAATRLP
jgi:hypothetical protein